MHNASSSIIKKINKIICLFTQLSLKKQVVILCALSIGFLFLSYKPKPQKIAPNPVAIDTYIPAGFVLVPIKIQNKKTLDGVIAAHGVVDLFIKKQNKTPVAIAQNVTILRSPLKPDEFGVLAPKNKAHILVQETNPFIVMAQNPNKKKEMKFLIEKKARRITTGNTNDGNF